jgi:hypothetical protein
MSQPTCEPIVEMIRKLTQVLYAIDDQLHALEVEGMNRLHPWRYLALQPQVDCFIKKITLPYRHLEYLVTGATITAITADFSPSGLEEVLAQLGIEL